MHKLFPSILCLITQLALAGDDLKVDKRMNVGQECVMNKNDSQITCADGRIYKLQEVPKSLSFRVKMKSDLRTRAPASNEGR